MELNYLEMTGFSERLGVIVADFCYENYLKSQIICILSKNNIDLIKACSNLFSFLLNKFKCKISNLFRKLLLFGRR